MPSRFFDLPLDDLIPQLPLSPNDFSALASASKQTRAAGSRGILLSALSIENDNSQKQLAALHHLLKQTDANMPLICGHTVDLLWALYQRKETDFTHQLLTIHCLLKIKRLEQTQVLQLDSELQCLCAYDPHLFAFLKAPEVFSLNASDTLGWLSNNHEIAPLIWPLLSQNMKQIICERLIDTMTDDCQLLSRLIKTMRFYACDKALLDKLLSTIKTYYQDLLSTIEVSTEFDCIFLSYELLRAINSLLSQAQQTDVTQRITAQLSTPINFEQYQASLTLRSYLGPQASTIKQLINIIENTSSCEDVRFSALRALNLRIPLIDTTAREQLLKLYLIWISQFPRHLHYSVIMEGLAIFASDRNLNVQAPFVLLDNHLSSLDSNSFGLCVKFIIPFIQRLDCVPSESLLQVAHESFDTPGWMARVAAIKFYSSLCIKNQNMGQLVSLSHFLFDDSPRVNEAVLIAYSKAFSYGFKLDAPDWQCIMELAASPQNRVALPAIECLCLYVCEEKQTSLVAFLFRLLEEGGSSIKKNVGQALLKLKPRLTPEVRNLIENSLLEIATRRTVAVDSQAGPVM